MKHFFKIALIIVMGTSCMVPAAQAQKNNSAKSKKMNSVLRAPKPKTNAQGFVNLLDCPRSIPNVKVDITTNEFGSYDVKVYLLGKLNDSFRCESTSDDVRFVDANFDGYYDIFIGPATSRNYSNLYLWDPQKMWFYKVVSKDNFNGYFLLNPAKKEWYSRGSSSYCSLYYERFYLDDDITVVTESLIDINDPKAHGEYGVRRRYTIIKGNDYENIAANRKQETNRLRNLPKQWQTIINAFDKAIK